MLTILMCDNSCGNCNYWRRYGKNCSSMLGGNGATEHGCCDRWEGKPDPAPEQDPRLNVCVDCGRTNNSVGGGTRRIVGGEWHCLGGCKPDSLDKARVAWTDSGGRPEQAIGLMLDYLESQRGPA